MHSCMFCVLMCVEYCRTICMDGVDAARVDGVIVVGATNRSVILCNNMCYGDE